MGGSEDLEAFRTYAREQQLRVDRILACRRRLGVLPDRTCASQAGVGWTGDITDPEFKKNLRIFHRLISGAVGIRERGLRRDPHQSSADGHKALEERVGALTDLVALPSNVPLTLKLLLGQRFELERILIEVGDEHYLRSRAADLYSEGESTMVTWEGLVRKGLFAGPPPLLSDLMPRPAKPASGSEATPKEGHDRGTEDAGNERSQLDSVERTRRMLAWLIAAKEAQDLPLRARRELKQQALLAVLPVIIATTILFGVAIGLIDEGENEFLLAAAAGAAGAALGGLLRLRDEVNFGAQIREFVPFFLGEVVVGAAAGLLVFVVVNAGIIQLGGGANGLAAFGFVVGFSEAAFLGLVSRVGETLLGTGKEETPKQTL